MEVESSSETEVTVMAEAPEASTGIIALNKASAKDANYGKKSLVWNYFEDVSPVKAKCRLCNTNLSRGIKLGKSGTTTPLRSHLQSKHKSEYSEMESKTSSKNETADPTRPPKKKQATLQRMLDKKKVWDINDQRAKTLHFKIGEMMALDNQPISIVEDPGFIRLINHLEPRYNIPSRRYFTEKIIPEIYELCRDGIQKLILDSQFISVTTDIWTCSYSNESFISLTGHWINSSYQLEHAALQAKYFPGSHSGDNIARILSQMLVDWKIEKEKVHLLIRDNGANIVKGVNDASLPNESCFIHKLQLTIQDSIKSQRAVNDMIGICRNIVTHFKHSSAACSKLKVIQSDLNVAPKKLIQDVKTRWNSTYYMLQSVLEQKRVITIFAADSDIANLTPNQWNLLEGTISLLQPFEEITKIVSSSESIISEVIPHVATLARYLEKVNLLHSGVGTLKSTLLERLKSRFGSVNSNPNFTIATFLDPRFKTFFFSPASRVEITELVFMELLKLRNVNDLPAQLTQGQDSSSSSTTSHTIAETTHSSCWDCFDELIAETTSTATERPSTVDEIKLRCEINSYVALAHLDRKENPISWWKSNHTTFPELAKLVKRWLSAPASSVYSERLFSETSNIFEDVRNRTLPRNGENLAFIHHNLPYLNYTYQINEAENNK